MRRWNENITQYRWVYNQLKDYGEVSRNTALNLYLSRLSGYIDKLRSKGWDIEGKYVRYERGLDFRYYLISKPTKTIQVPERLDGDTVRMVSKQVELF